MRKLIVVLISFGLLFVFGPASSAAQVSPLESGLCRDANGELCMRTILPAVSPDQTVAAAASRNKSKTIIFALGLSTMPRDVLPSWPCLVAARWWFFNPRICWVLAPDSSNRGLSK